MTGVLWLASQTIARQIISFVLFAILGRLLGPTEFGTVALSTSIIIILQSFSSQGITQAVIQKSDITEAELDVAYSINCFTSLAITLFLVLGLNLYYFMLGLNYDKFYAVFSVLSLSPLISAGYEIHQAYLTRNFRFDIFAKKALASQFVGGFVAVGSALLGANVWSLVCQQTAALAIEFAVVRGASKWRAKLQFDRSAAAHLSRFGVYLFGARLLNVADLRGPDLIVGFSAGQTALGFFRIARSIFDVTLAVFGSPLQSVCLPLFSSKQKNLAAVRSTFLQMTEAISWSILPPFFALAIWASTWIEVAFGSKWRASGWILQMLAFQAVFYAMFYLYDPLLVSLGRAREIFTLRCWQSGISIVCVLAASHFGLRAMVIAQVMAVFISGPIIFRYISHAIDIKASSFFRIFWKPVSCTGVFVSIGYFLDAYIGRNYGLAGLIISLAVAYGCFCLLFIRYAAPELRTSALHAVGRIVPRFASNKTQ